MNLKAFGLIFIILSRFEFSEASNLSTLVDNLFQNYHNDVRPVCDSESTVQVRLGLALRQIVDLNEPKQIIEINAWIRMRWNDCHLRWNASLYGIDHLVVPYNKVWVPDITLYDNVDSQLLGLKDYRPAIYSDGSMVYNFPTIISSLCKVDVTYFPFDQQICRLQFGSWAHHGLELNVTGIEADLSAFVDSVEWELISVPMIRKVIYYKCCPEPYPDVSFYLKMRRKPLFYLMNLVFPCMLISTVACLGFILPPDSGEKVSLEITVLLSLAVFLMVVSETMPPSSETFPYIGAYFTCAMLLVSMSCLMTVVVLNLHFKGGHGKRVPLYLRRIFAVLAKMVFVKVREKELVEPTSPSPKERRVTHHDNLAYEHTNGNNTTVDKPKHEKIGNFFHNGFHHLHDCSLTEITTNSDSRATEDGGSGEQFVESSAASEIAKAVKQQLSILRNIENILTKKRILAESVDEWQNMAQIMDRVFLIFFALVSFTSSLTFLMNSYLHDDE
ncbi:neuronal acetylcholine receptor subunit alpha-10-like isoform X2 [Ostrea edulis]|uniref:neuronal acetylcholine receptor subunit alpha-10-like isoform X2 n=1 Tax=Ostrea edulis TaxID=37623 RepID=UPI0024AEA6DE|nr:neuronal acetylcholine receptor subunit alpha-10-like isoform X2 [Ostrea edulis]